MRALKEGIFTQFFRKQDKKLEEAVETLFDEIFLDAFVNQDDELINKEQYCNIVNDKLEDDAALRDVLLAQFSGIDKDEDGMVDQEDCKKALAQIMKEQMEKLLIEKEQATEIRTEEAFRSGQYAKETINQII